jgi:hypothetical protein
MFLGWFGIRYRLAFRTIVVMPLGLGLLLDYIGVTAGPAFSIDRFVP